MKTIAYDTTPGGVMVQVHYGTAPDEEWNAVVDDLERRLLELAGVVAIALGEGGPTPSQRERLNAVVSRMPEATHFALLSDSRVTRGILTAINWLTGRHEQSHVFSADDLEGALRALRLTPEQSEEVRAMVEQLKARAASS
jgi:hypothetical protein